jgi:putative ABC transport system permease protein
MSWLWKLCARFRALFQRERLDRDMAEEMSLHIEMQTQENIEAGLRPEEARREALRQFGWVESIKESCRDARGLKCIEDFAQDARFGVRKIVRNPAFAVLAVLILALGIGANTAVFSVVDKMILHPFPGGKGARLVTLRERDVMHDAMWEMAPPLFAQLSTRSDLFASLAAYCLPSGFKLERGGDIVEVSAVSTTPGLFATLGAHPMAGRLFLPSEGASGQDRVVVVSYGFWQSYFVGDPGFVGRTVTLNGEPYTVIGIMPPTFQFPLSAKQNQVWLPHVFRQEEVDDPEQVRNRVWNVIARLQNGVPLGRVRSFLDSLTRIRQEQTREPGKKWAIVLQPARLGGPTLAATLWSLQGAVAMLLVIACANVATLLVAQAIARRGEFSIRMAIGAGRSRLMRQLTTESLMLVGLAGLTGLFFAWAGIRALDRFYLGDLARMRFIGVDRSVLALTVLVSAFAGVMFTATPVWLISRVRLSEGLRDASREHGESGLQRLFRDGLVVLQVGLAVVLLVGAGLMVQTVRRLLRVDPGLDPRGLYQVAYDPQPLMEITRPESEALKQGGAARQKAIAEWWVNEVQTELRWDETMVEKLRAIPGIESAAINGNSGSSYAFGDYRVEGRDDLVQLSPSAVGIRSGNYFQTLRLPLVAGRLFTKEDCIPGAESVVINQTLARRCWPGQDALGKRLVSNDEFSDHYTVVGVVKDMLDWRTDTPQQPTLYVPVERLTKYSVRRGSFILRVGPGADALPGILKRLGREMVPPVEIRFLNSVEHELYRSTAPRRVYMWLLNTMGALSLLLSALGIYAVVAYSVVRRRHEIGIRMALGATRGSIARLIVGRGARLVVSGLLLGMVAAFTLTQYLRSLLYQVTPGNLSVYGAALLILGGVALLACYLPARRAARIDPMAALRHE